MTESLPPPLTDLSIDAAGIAGFILDTVRLLSSELVAVSTGDEFKAAVLLWSHAWQQKPPASLPDDERVLAHFSGLTGNLPKWRKVRHMAMRGFVKCSDGRWYHPVLAEDARRAAKARQQRRDAIAKRYEKQDDPPTPEPTRKPTAVGTTERTAELPVQSSTNPVPEPKKEFKNQSLGFGSGGSALPRPGSAFALRGIDWSGIVIRMTNGHGFEINQAWALCTAIGEREDIARRMQGAMRAAEKRRQSAFTALVAIAQEAGAATEQRRSA